MISRSKRRDPKICLECSEPLDESRVQEGQDSKYHLKCYLDLLVRLRDKHGEETCFFCQFFDVNMGLGGKGVCQKTKKDCGSSKHRCHRFKGKIKLFKGLEWENRLI